MNPNIQTEERPKTRAKSANLEHKLQAECVKWFGQTYPERRGQLIGYFAETTNVREGGIKTALGLQSGVSDLLYFTDGAKFFGIQTRAIIGIEMKALGTYHSVAHLRGQAEWLLRVPDLGFFCDSLAGFKDVIINFAYGIDPRTVLKNLESVKTKTVLWDSVRE